MFPVSLWRLIFSPDSHRASTQARLAHWDVVDWSEVKLVSTVVKLRPHPPQSEHNKSVTRKLARDGDQLVYSDGLDLAERVTHHKVVEPTKFDMMSCYNNACIPVGFRFYPTDEELVGFYLFGRITTPPPDPSEEDQRIIREIDLYRHEPWDLSEVCKIPGDHSVNQNNWYFFSHKDKKYPTGNRANRATKAGFWKATGRDKCIQTQGALGMRKTLVFYRGRAPHGQKTDWIMHEFRLADGTTANQSSTSFQRTQNYDFHEGAGAWVVCRVFRKTKNLKSKGDNDTPTTTSLEEDHQMALLPDITDSTERFSSDESDHVDYPPSDHMVQHLFNTNTMQQQDQQHCKQELSVADYVRIGVEHDTMAVPQTSIFRSCSSTPISCCNTVQLDPGADYKHHMDMAGPTLFSAAGLFSPSPNNPYLLSMLDNHIARGDIRSLHKSYGSSGPAMLDELEDFRRLGGNPVSFLDQSLTEVVTRPPGILQLQHLRELLNSNPNDDMVSFELPSQGGSGSHSGVVTDQQITFVDISDSVNSTFCHFDIEVGLSATNQRGLQY
ncbi:hypothetical protein KC19_VG259100 [Ceratodon purpureus]|uniref:NAC domain-containing protein n=1 Tax=Ceratodon purpureus TaxID=3225 RepID=A0A8T0HUH0_CERPU|nr:hypothetical protein KC19_VG259100 [Ceratodon purpureus]